eukprot:Nk52_evm1s2207 gene=Nk52_evmTU1s2207
MRVGRFELYLTDNQGQPYPEVTLDSALGVKDPNPTFAVAEIGEEFSIQCVHHGDWDDEWGCLTKGNEDYQLTAVYKVDGQPLPSAKTFGKGKRRVVVHKGHYDYVNQTVKPFVFDEPTFADPNSVTGSTAVELYMGSIEVKIYRTELLEGETDLGSVSSSSRGSATDRKGFVDVNKKFKRASAGTGYGAIRKEKGLARAGVKLQYHEVLETLTLYYHTLKRLNLISPPDVYGKLVKSLCWYSPKVKLPPELPEDEIPLAKRCKQEGNDKKTPLVIRNGVIIIEEEEEEDESDQVEFVKVEDRRKPAFVDLQDLEEL